MNQPEKSHVEGSPHLSSQDLYLFNEGTHLRLYEHLGAHPIIEAGVAGTHFAVWAPAARAVEVIGDFNGWHGANSALSPLGSSGVWEGFLPEVSAGALYKYRITAPDGHRFDKADPFGFRHELPPATASVVARLDGHQWEDAGWMSEREHRNALGAPMSVYEVHLGSWRRDPTRPTEPLSFEQLAEPLARYAVEMGFTHVELMPIMEHPFYGSWGYQITGYFAPSSRYGTPADFMRFVDILHQYGVGVILDWVPSHFPDDPHGLAFFDGTHLFEHADPRQGVHPDWGSLIFNYGRLEVRSFLFSNALFWLDKYHIDGLRVDAVASMLYLDYSRAEGEWIPNEHGGRENLAAVDFLRRLNEAVYEYYPSAQTIAEESTAWPMVSRPTSSGGLGFGLKWDMGWMHDTLEYLAHDPVHRRHHHNEITFRSIYAFTENFTLPLSHDEVVHGKGSLLRRMPGDEWQRFANLRLLLGYQFAQPGKKLLFMGGEFGQMAEWSHEASLDWHETNHPSNLGVQRWVQALNRLYQSEAALHDLDFDPAGFEWSVADDDQNSVLVFTRLSKQRERAVVVACNFTPVIREPYDCPCPWAGEWHVIANSDAAEYGGSGVDARATCKTDNAVLTLRLPPLAIVMVAGNRSGDVRHDRQAAITER